MKSPVIRIVFVICLFLQYLPVWSEPGGQSAAAPNQPSLTEEIQATAGALDDSHRRTEEASAPGAGRPEPKPELAGSVPMPLTAEVVPPPAAAAGAPAVDGQRKSLLRSWNRVMVQFDMALDRFAAQPVAMYFKEHVWQPIQDMLWNFFDNHKSLRRFMNHLLQGNYDLARKELLRILLNTTAGGAGFFDVATPIGKKFGTSLESTDADFGQTLARWFRSWRESALLVLPFFEPMTVRDTLGFAVDSALDPVGWIASMFTLMGAEALERTVDRTRQPRIYYDKCGDTFTEKDYDDLEKDVQDRRKNFIDGIKSDPRPEVIDCSDRQP